MLSILGFGFMWLILFLDIFLLVKLYFLIVSYVKLINTAFRSYERAKKKVDARHFMMVYNQVRRKTELDTEFMNLISHVAFFALYVWSAFNIGINLFNTFIIILFK